MDKKMGMSEQILEEIKRYKKINNYIVEQAEKKRPVPKNLKSLIWLNPKKILKQNKKNILITYFRNFQILSKNCPTWTK